jgi:hypothetical protein
MQTETPAEELTTALKSLLKDVDTTKLVATRNSRLRAVSKKRQSLLDDELASLDSLLLVLQTRKDWIEGGRVEEFVDPTAHERSSEEHDLDAVEDEISSESTSVESTEAAPEESPGGQLELEVLVDSPTDEPTVNDAEADSNRDEVIIEVDAPPGELADDPEPESTIGDVEADTGDKPPQMDESPGIEPLKASLPNERPEDSVTEDEESFEAEVIVDTGEFDYDEVLRGFEAPPPSDTPTEGWTWAAELLFDDVLRLFGLNDSEGALVSLERLLTSTELNQDLVEFISMNEERLIDLYKLRFGTFDKVPLQGRSREHFPNAFYTNKVSTVMDLVDGRRTIESIISGCGMSQLEAVSVLSQLVRAGIVMTEAQSE